MWSIGELAEAAGVTVRALHHYDHLGLLAPSERSEGGHRRYTEDDVARLYRILALRDLGLSLEEIASLLSDEEGPSPVAVIEEHLQRVTGELERSARLRQRLSQLKGIVERADKPSADLLIDAMQTMTSTVSIDQITTRVGDGGETLLGDTTVAPKQHPRVEAGGTVEELNAHIGAVVAADELAEHYSGWLRRIQNELFDVGADISVPPAVVGDGDREQPRLRISQVYIDRLEGDCEQAGLDLKPLDSFVVPGGSPILAQLHICRTVCRRAERRAVEIPDANPYVIRYLNRLSDLLFLITRATAGPAERLWEPGEAE